MDIQNPTGLKELIQSLAPEAPGVIEGTVTNASPLQITLANDSKMVLGKNSLIVPRHLTDYMVEVDVQKSAGAFSCPKIGTPKVLRNPPEAGSKSSSGAGATLPRRRPHSGSQGQTRGTFVPRSCGMIQQAGGSGCARLQRASASSGVAAPQGCAALLCICRTDKICCNRFCTMVR